VALDWDQVVAGGCRRALGESGRPRELGNVNLVFALPDRTMSGLAVLFSAAGH